MRERDCELLIDECREMMRSIEDRISYYFNHTTNDEIKIPKVKSFLEHCRSILEYCAKDIFENIISDDERINKLNSEQKNIYFPYGKKKFQFERSIRFNLPKLYRNREVYKLLENLQDFKRSREDQFLYYMCFLTNENKHEEISKQGRKITGTNIGGLIEISNNAHVNINGLNINGVTLGNFSVEQGEITNPSNPELFSQIFIYKEGYLVFKDSDKPVLLFLKQCLEEVDKFQNELYKLIN
ncbi:hypothetical protein [Niallia taxi]|uniref:hypothetical protein n=1 Tax=Niallia taxi TaxID=2499688 RepID=UPI002E1FA85D|nr:hypothetical protein [Niallia taxi]